MEDSGFEGQGDITVVRPVRRLQVLAKTAERDHADVVMIDTTFPEGRSFQTIAVAVLK